MEYVSTQACCYSHGYLTPALKALEAGITRTAGSLATVFSLDMGERKKSVTLSKQILVRFDLILLG